MIPNSFTITNDSDGATFTSHFERLPDDTFVDTNSDGVTTSLLSVRHLDGKKEHRSSISSGVTSVNEAGQPIFWGVIITFRWSPNHNFTLSERVQHLFVCHRAYLANAARILRKEK